MTARAIQIATRAEIFSKDDFIKYVDEALIEIKKEIINDVIETSRMVQHDFDGKTGMYWEEWIQHINEVFNDTILL